MIQFIKSEKSKIFHLFNLLWAYHVQQVSKSNIVLVFSFETIPCLQSKPFKSSDFPLVRPQSFQIRLISLHNGDVVR